MSTPPAPAVASRFSSEVAGNVKPPGKRVIALTLPGTWKPDVGSGQFQLRSGERPAGRGNGEMASVARAGAENEWAGGVGRTVGRSE